MIILPPLILVADRWIFGWMHRSIIPDLGLWARLVPKIRIPLALVFVVLFIPALYGSSKAKITYNIESTFPARLPSIVAAGEIRRTFGTVDTVNLVTKDLRPYEMDAILNKLGHLDGIRQIMSYHNLVDSAIPNVFVPEKVKARFLAGGYQNTTILLADRAAAPRAAQTIAAANKIIQPYRGKAYITGQVALTVDMAEAAKSDMPRVNNLSLLLVLLPNF